MMTFSVQHVSSAVPIRPQLLILETWGQNLQPATQKIWFLGSKFDTQLRKCGFWGQKRDAHLV